MLARLITISFLLISVVACSKTEAPCTQSIWYLDLDGDGLGDRTKATMDCLQPAGYVSNDKDDNDRPVGVSEIPAKGYTTPKTYPGLQLVWADEFDGTALDEKYWNYEIGDGCPGNCGWGNNELEYYKKENTTVKEGHLFIEAKRESIGGKQYSSSRLTTQNKFNVKYGRIDIRAVLPKGKGLWPALWMLGKNIDVVGWPKCGEIDIMELVGGLTTDNEIHGTVHWDHNNSRAQYGGSTKLQSGTFNDEFHVFSITWDEKFIRWFLDDKQYHVIDTSPVGLSEFQEEFFLLFNVAVGGNWPGNPDGTTTFPQKMIVDYVRVFK
jgi:beta-glucanase (GH16 family)